MHIFSMVIAGFILLTGANKARVNAPLLLAGQGVKSLPFFLSVVFAQSTEVLKY